MAARSKPTQASTARCRGAILQKTEKKLQQEVRQLMALAESEDRKNVPDGMEVPEEIALRQQRLAVLDEAKRKLEARAKERDQAPQAEYEGKLPKRLAKRDTGKKPGGKDPEPQGNCAAILSDG
jgi:hypothetical protein